MRRVEPTMINDPSISPHVCFWVLRKEAYATKWESAQVRGESEWYPATPDHKRSHDRQWWYVSLMMNLDTTSCKREVGEGVRRMLSGRSPVASAGICCPYCHTPPPPSIAAHCPPSLPAGHWRGRLAHCRAQPANGRHAIPEGLVRVWPRGISSLHTPSRGLTLVHDTYRDTQCRNSAGRLSHWGGGCSICSLWKVLAPFSH